jgi:hypothetical protein
MIDIGTKTFRQTDRQRIETLDQANGVGLGVVAGNDRQAPRTRRAGLCREQRGALAGKALRWSPARTRNPTNKGAD